MNFLKLKLKVYKDNDLIIEKILEYQKENDIISFEFENTSHQIDIKNKILERYTNEFHFYLDFSKETCTYELINPHAVFDIIVDQSFFEEKKNGLEMSYALETDDQKCTILIEF